MIKCNTKIAKRCIRNESIVQGELSVYWRVRIFLISVGKPIIMNSVFGNVEAEECAMDDIHWDIWLPQRVAVRLRWEKRLRRRIWRVGCHRQTAQSDGGQQKETLLFGKTVWCIYRMKRSGIRMEPWGTSQEKARGCEAWLDALTT